MMKFILKWFFWIPVFLVVALFLAANRQPVAISLDPFNASNPAVTTPALFLWVWLMLIFFMGFGLGVIGMWVSARPRRQKARMERRELKTLRKEMAALEKQAVEKPPAPADEELPLLESSPA